MQLIGITTPMEEGCDYSMMMDLKHENGKGRIPPFQSNPLFFNLCVCCARDETITNSEDICFGFYVSLLYHYHYNGVPKHRRPDV